MSTAHTTLYDADFYAWTQQQADALRADKLGTLDVENLIEEIEDMGKRQKQELRSRLKVLFMHLLKWQYQPNLQSRSWQLTIKEQRFEIREHIAENPSLKHLLHEIIDGAYRGALIGAEHETGLNKTAFPPVCPWTFEQAMDDDFWPEANTAPTVR